MHKYYIRRKKRELTLKKYWLWELQSIIKLTPKKNDMIKKYQESNDVKTYKDEGTNQIKKNKNWTNNGK